MLAGSKIVYIFLYVKDLARSRDFFEKKLGLMVLEEEDDAVKYDAGGVMLALNRADTQRIPVDDRHDDTSIMVFHTDQVHELRAALEMRGLQFDCPTFTSHVGTIASFYDPDGHCFSLYQPNEFANSRESGRRIAEIVEAQYQGPGLPAPPSGRALDEIGLAATKLVYLFLFVRDFDESRDFYEAKLGLQPLEASREAGVSKYEVGNLLIATHQIDTEDGARAKLEDLSRPRSIAPVFCVTNLDAVCESLARNGARPTSPSSPQQIGRLCRVTDPSGHGFYVYEPSLEALSWVSGAKIRAFDVRRRAGLAPAPAALPAGASRV
jgi:catechol 2,3-dioxygenase-like lactoylglutathione lyase family enzyme